MRKLLGDDFTKIKDALNTKTKENSNILEKPNECFTIQNQDGDYQVILNKDNEDLLEVINGVVEEMVENVE